MTSQHSTPWLVLTASFSVGLLLHQSTACAEEGHRVSVTLEHSIQFMGEPLAAVFRLHNDSNEDWNIREPNNSPAGVWECEWIGPNDRRSGTGRRFGNYDSIKTVADGVVIEAIVEKRSPIITIVPGKFYEFHRNLHEPYARFDQNFHPGHWTLKMTYWEAATRTNHESKLVEFEIALTEEFIDWCLATYRDRKADRSDRRWAGDYLHKLRNDLEFGEADETIPARLRDPWNLRVAKDEVTFVEWWKKNRDTTEGRQAIDAINEYYGLDPAKVRKAGQEYKATKKRPPPTSPLKK